MKTLLFGLLCTTLLLCGCSVETKYIYVTKDNCSDRISIKWEDEVLRCYVEWWRKKISVYKLYEWSWYIYLPSDWSPWARWRMECK